MGRIAKLSNRRLRYLLKLRLKKYRQQERAFLVEGRRLIESAIASNWSVEEIYLSEKVSDSLRGWKLGEEIGLRKIPLFSGNRRQITSLCQTRTPQGMVALVRIKDLVWDDFPGEEVDLVLLLEDLKDPGNLGTIIRTAHGFGLGAVFLTKGCVELLNPKVIRATMGSLFCVPILSEASAPLGPKFSPPELIKMLKQKGFEVIVCSPDARTEVYRKRFRKRVCLVIGSEPTGVSEDLEELADFSVRIPTVPSLESLNVATACAVFLYEIRRQRELPGQS